VALGALHGGEDAPRANAQQWRDLAAPGGQLAFDWAPGQLGFDGRTYEPPGIIEVETEPEAPSPKGEPLLGLLHGLLPGTAERWNRQMEMWDRFGPEKDEHGDVIHGTGERVAKCRKVRILSETTAMVRSAGGGWDVRGTVRCRNAHVCPLCAWQRARETAAQISACVEAHQAGGGLAPDVWMLTLTQPHTAEQAWSTSIERLTEAWRRLKRSPEWRRFAKRWGLVGAVRCWDSTIGANGLHGHWHVGLFVDQAIWAGDRIDQLPELERGIVLAAIGDELRDAWVRVSLAAGVEVAGDVGRESFRELGLDLRGGEDAAVYLASWGLPQELALSPAKRGRSHWSELDAAAAGDAAAGERFDRYYAATSGLAVVTGLKRLRDRLGVTDELVAAHVAELALRRELQAELDGVELPEVEPLELRISPYRWHAALRATWPRLFAIVEAAEAQGRDPQRALDDYLAAVDRGRNTGPPPEPGEPT
jgi:hypothetical protein